MQDLDRPMQTATQPESARKLLVLDLDETLIHATSAPLTSACDFRFEGYHIYLRPHVAAFLEFAFSRFDVGVWTSAGNLYADCVVAQLFRQQAPVFVFSAQQCTLRRDFLGTGYTPVKRLSKLKSRGYRLEQMIAVDDTPEKLQDNYGNLVRVAEFTGDASDHELPALAEYLETLAKVPNVRTVEKRGWRRQVQQAGMPAGEARIDPTGKPAPH